MSQFVLHEVSLRDGLQMEKQVVPLERKIAWAERMFCAGIEIVQLGSFVHPEKVPQMADTDALFSYFSKPENHPQGTVLSGLVLNEKGLERGLSCGVEMFCMGVSASETHSQKNTGMSVGDATRRIIATARQALSQGKRVQVSVQSAFGCGFEGEIPQAKVLDIVSAYLSEGLKNISLADTAGHALPEQVERMFLSIRKLDQSVECTCHLHNTYGLGLANCRAAMNAGVKYFETAIAGLGGCPFTKVAGGNVCTEDFIHYLSRSGRSARYDLNALIEIARDMSGYFARELPGLVHKSGPLSYSPALNR